MPTTQLPFFLSSDRASEVDATGSRFRVKLNLNPPIDIPRAATHTRVFVQEASVVYSMKNINSTNKTFRVQLGLPAAGSQHVYTLSIDRSGSVFSGVERRCRGYYGSSPSFCAVWSLRLGSTWQEWPEGVQNLRTADVLWHGLYTHLHSRIRHSTDLPLQSSIFKNSAPYRPSPNLVNITIDRIGKVGDE
eukprot:COSAG01_NODE_4784_length_4746_cov_239.649236_4_plen_190_part_00